MQVIPVSHIDITWEVAGVLTVIIGAATGVLTRYVKYSIVSALAILKLELIASALENKAALIKELNGTYVKTQVCEAVMESVNVKAKEETRRSAMELLRSNREATIEGRLERLEHPGSLLHNED